MANLTRYKEDVENVYHDCVFTEFCIPYKFILDIKPDYYPLFKHFCNQTLMEFVL